MPDAPPALTADGITTGYGEGRHARRVQKLKLLEEEERAVKRSAGLTQRKENRFVFSPRSSALSV